MSGKQAMAKLSYFVCSLVVIAAVPPSFTVSAQQPQTSSRSRSDIKTAAEEVLLDVVVRDKKGHRVDNLKPEDFQIFDNGELKKITSFRLVHGGEAFGTSGTGNVRTQLDPLRQIRLLTMIFHCSDNTSRRLARDAALDLLQGELPQNVYVAIMVIDFKLEVLQAFTNDTALIRQAIDHATRSDVTDFSKDTEWVRIQLEHRLGPGESYGPPPVARPPGGAGSAGAEARRVIDDMLLKMIREQQSYDRIQAGRTTIYSLLDLVKEQYRLPGRKTVLYFSGGFVRPQELDELFEQVISIANRSNVSFYTVDAHGLMTTSTNRATIDILNRAAQTSQAQATSPNDGYITSDEWHLMDTAIASTRANPQTALEELAEATGGAMIANTNDLRTPLGKLAEDIQTYYEISYNPEIKTYDGSFRKISIKLGSSDLRVQSRSGYIALPPTLAKGSVLRLRGSPANRPGRGRAAQGVWL